MIPQSAIELIKVHIKKFPNIYILDTNTALSLDFWLDRYTEEGVTPGPCIFILISPVLREMNNLNYKVNNEKRKNISEYLKKLRSLALSNKLSEGVRIKKDFLILLPVKGVHKNSSDVSIWYEETCADSILIDVLRAMSNLLNNNGITLLSRDSYLQIICKELSINYLYAEPSTKSTGFIKNGEFSNDAIDTKSTSVQFSELVEDKTGEIRADEFIKYTELPELYNKNNIN